MTRGTHKLLGQILVEGKVLPQNKLEEALKEQKESGGLIGQILVKLGFATEETIAMALTSQNGFPYLPLGGYEIDPEIAKLLSQEISKKYELIVVDRVGNVITVAMSDPLNKEAQQELEKVAQYKVQVFVSTSTDIREAIKRCYRG